MATIHEHTKQLIKLAHRPNTHSICDHVWDLFNCFLLLCNKDVHALTEHDLVEFIAFLSLVPMVGPLIHTYVSGVCHHLKIHMLNNFQHSFLIALVLCGVTSPECQRDV